ncbi:GPI transamidase component PIG-S isoform X2 [Olea europaea var. sylvestris]|uniref:GPI transamidase component PIG-S isoform X2 n=1 Tax=Olea europaea var. sylvestris TaxID=158386 RepID=UPI000C1D1993|nr:GPI transamidase component PIG-S isoform X2 [Olea europaea var. sylvestris]
MAEISEASSTSTTDPDFDPETMRKSKPGLKRLSLTLTVLFSYLLGLPFLLKSIEIYRSPLPFREIDDLSTAIESSPILFPCHFRAVFVNFDPNSYTADQLSVSVQAYMAKLATKNSPACGTCASNFTVYVTIDSNSNCITNGNNVDWKCGALNEFKFAEKRDDGLLDEYLESVFYNNNNNNNNNNNSNGKVYTVVVVKTEEEEVSAVVGQYRHAWIMGRVFEEQAVEKIAEIFVKVFVNGGKEEGLIHGEFMPVGADGKIVLSFNLLNADPHDWIYDWDFREIDENLLTPIIAALKPLADVSVESQVLYHTPKASFSIWDDKLDSYIFSTKDLPFFVNSNEWHLDTSVAAGGRSKILQYVPSAKECPLRLQLPNGEISTTNGFISPMWGGIVVWNPSACLMDSKLKHPLRRKIPPEDSRKVFEIFMGQLRQLFGLKSDGLFVGASGTSVLLASERGFSEWELDVLSRQHSCFNLLQCGTTLGSISRLVQSLPRMIIMDDIGKQVKYSLEAAKLTLSNASLGIYDASAESSRQARLLAEDAFYHPSMMSVSYYSFEHCFAVYSPFFLPVTLHVLLAVLREWKRYKQESKKYNAWQAKVK